MDLVIRNYKDKELNIPRNRESDDGICYMKVNIPLILEDNVISNNSLQENGCKFKLNEVEKRKAIRKFFNMTENQKNVKNRMSDEDGQNETIIISQNSTISSLTINQSSFTQLKLNQVLVNITNLEPMSNLTSNSSSTNNSTTPITNYTVIQIQIIDSGQEDIDIISHYLQNYTPPQNKDEICSKCFDNYRYLNELFTEVRSIKKDLKDFTNKTNSKQDTIIKFSDYINRINLIKIEMYQINFALDILKNSQCSDYEKNNEKFQATIKRANILIEVIQDSIRKQNLNVNFIVIT